MARSDAVVRTPDGLPLSRADGLWNRLDLLPRALYWGVHAACLLALWTGVSRGALLLLAATLFGRMFAITGGYHRYFAHRTFRTSRAFQFVLAFLGASSAQKGPLWWAGHHRVHHAHADRPGDVHSPRRSWWYAHQSWIFDPVTNPTPLDQIPDFARYPEIVWLNRYHFVAPLALIGLCLAVGGLSGFVWGFAVSTTLLWHFTYTINSLAHLWGTRRYDTPDDSRNNVLLALITLGEGWHNNHHYYPTSVRQGFYWWEVDLTWYGLKLLSWLGIVWDLKPIPAAVRDARPRRLP